MKNIFKSMMLLVAIIVIATSCQYKFLVEPTIPPPEPGDTVSFSLEVEPIFTDKNCVACHNAGQQDPDLTTGNAYNSITSMGLVNTDDPESSIIYSVPIPSGGHYIMYSSANAALVLQWIEQGAKNN